ncbi:hypothetical protein [Macrococcoides caseolyticum]|uniref:hypothetical protein n=1 Tax=Macrococcoides caseolyticum TaxID=69966 RepID=UPI000C347B88|nr:hypothetical protein [Macrococcus caseolyticus]PKD99979.1 hypothetical protein CW719_00370 [Macrococcus caseolyticus]PKE62158.1 hypothetical protein CW683_11855 [Macrococcus caseolyticus]PKF20064.1 hypothetical protein CW717_00370 [Macrococcus caseolyticus]
MNKIKSTLIINVSQICNILFTLIFQLLLLKYYEIEFIGLVTTNIALVNVLSNLFCFGLGNFIISKFSKFYDSIYNYKRVIYLYIFITGVISFLLMIAIGRFYNNDIWISLTFFNLLLSTSLTSFISSIQQLNKQFVKLAIILSTVPFIKFLSICISIIFNFNQFVFLGTIEILSLLITLHSFFLIKSYLSSDKNNYQVSLKLFVKEVTPYGFLNFCFIIYTNSAIVIMGIYGYNKFSVYASTSLLFINCILMIPTILIQKIYAVEIYNLILEKSEKIFEIKNKLIKILSIYCLIVISAYFLIGNQIISIIFEDKSEVLTSSLNILLVSLLLKLINLVNSLVLSSVLFVKIRVRFEIIVCIIQVILLLIFIPHLNYYNLLWLMIGIDTIWFMGYYLLAKKNLKGIKS